MFGVDAFVYQSISRFLNTSDVGLGLMPLFVVVSLGSLGL